MADFAGIAFNVIQQADGVQLGWTSSPRYADFPIPGGTRVVTQAGGFDLEQLQIGVILAGGMADYLALKALEGTEGTLTDYPVAGLPDYATVRLRTAGQPSVYVLHDLQCVRTTLSFTRRRP